MRCHLCGGQFPVDWNPIPGTLCLRCTCDLARRARAETEAAIEVRQKQRAAFNALVRGAASKFLGQRITRVALDALDDRLKAYSLIADQLVESSGSPDIEGEPDAG